LVLLLASLPIVVLLILLLLLAFEHYGDQDVALNQLHKFVLATKSDPGKVVT